MKKLIFLIAGLLAFSGCVGDSMQISTCKSYKNGICVVSEVKEVIKCKNPRLINGKTYCEK